MTFPRKVTICDTMSACTQDFHVEYLPMDPSFDAEDEYIWRLVHPATDEFAILQRQGWCVGIIGSNDKIDTPRWLRLSRSLKVDPRNPHEDYDDQYNWTAENVREAPARKLQAEGWQIAKMSSPDLFSGFVNHGSVAHNYEYAFWFSVLNLIFKN